MSQPYNAPKCFGSNLWSPSTAECVGGPDPGYVNPNTGAQVRDKCDWYSSCASTSVSNRSTEQKLIPVSNLTQHMPIGPVQIQAPPKPAVSTAMAPQRQVMPVQWQPPWQPQQQQQQWQQVQQQMMLPQQMQQMAQMVPAWMAQFGPQQVPSPFQQPGMQMPSYLAIPEPVDPSGAGMWGRLFREVIRSLFKSAGHTGAHFFDHNPMKMFAMPQQPQQPQQPPPQ